MEQQIKNCIHSLFTTEIEVKLTRPEPQFGDYATNVALQLAASLGKNPREVAEAIAEKLRDDEDFIDVNVAGPGFINIRLSDSALIKQVYERPETLRKDELIVIETNNPNPFKPMHIGHAYNSILGDTIANLLAVSGANVKRVSYHGDVGTHVGRSMWSLLKYTEGNPEKLTNIPANERNSFMGKMYAEGSRAAKEDETVKAEVDELAKQSFIRKDGNFNAIYEIIFDWSFTQIDAILKRIGNVPIERRYLESETEVPGKELIIDNTPRVFTLSNGAYIFEGSKYGSFDNIYIGSHGNGLYGAHDMGLVQLKRQDYPQLSASYVPTGGEQAAYFKGVIAASELAIPELEGKLFNIPTGLVKLSSGKMSSRTGDVVEIDWLFDEFAKAIEARGGEATDEIIAGALRYQFLKVKIGGDVIFDVSEAVSLSGNTGSYLQYAYARARQLIEKSTAKFMRSNDLYEEDKSLMRKLSEYHEVVNLATRELAPHHICNYLFDLAQEFNRYYEKNRVVGDDREAHRVSLVTLYADILKAGLSMLGIEAPGKI